MKRLYALFVYNGVPWNTVNTAYLDRFYICRQDADYGIYSGLLERGLMPLWNIEHISFDGEAFMIPCMDGKYYEHEFRPRGYDADSGYMIEGNKEISSIRYEEGKIIIVSDKESFEGWRAYRFAPEGSGHTYGYDRKILSNQRNMGFMDSALSMRGMGLRSRTELAGYVESLNVGEDIEYLSCEVVGESDETEHYIADMNSFVRDEVFPMDARKVLKLRFGLKDGASRERAEDMLRYVLSQLQLNIYEYRCEGVLV